MPNTRRKYKCLEWWRGGSNPLISSKICSLKQQYVILSVRLQLLGGLASVGLEQGKRASTCRPRDAGSRWNNFI